jgi:hypothetical protein
MDLLVRLRRNPIECWSAEFFQEPIVSRLRWPLSPCIDAPLILIDTVKVERGLNRHVQQVFNPDRKDTHWGKRKLARDR